MFQVKRITCDTKEFAKYQKVLLKVYEKKTYLVKLHKVLDPISCSLHPFLYSLDFSMKWEKIISGGKFLFFKVHIFWEGHKILRNLHRRFVLCSAVLPVKSTVEISPNFMAFSEYMNFTNKHLFEICISSILLPKIAMLVQYHPLFMSEAWQKGRGFKSRWELRNMQAELFSRT